MKPQDPKDEALVALLRLKRYEQPDPNFEARNLAAIRTRLAQLPERRGWGQIVWGWFEQTPSPVLRYSMATALVVLVGLNVLTFTLMPQSSPVAVVTNHTPTVARTEAPAPDLAPGPLAVAPTNEAWAPSDKPVFVFEFPASNRVRGGGMEYGTGPAVPVRFDY